MAFAPGAAAVAGEPGSEPDLSVVTDSMQGADVLARAGDTLVLGGEFTHLWYRTGPGAILTGPDGKVDRRTPEFRDGKVNVATADGEGGWYVGGTFTQVGTTPGIARLAHVESDGELDRDWAPNPDGPVRALALDAAGDVIVGGEFTTVGGGSRGGLAQLDPVTGAATAWNPEVSGTVSAIAVGPDDTVYAGGNFTAVGATPRNRLAAFAPQTRDLTPWDPSVNQGAVNALVATEGAVYAGGSFTTVGSEPVTRNRLAAFDPAGGAVTDWDPNMNNTVNALALAPDGTLYAGGSFTKVGAATRNRIASFATADPGAPLTSWAPSVNGTVSALSVGPTGSVYLGGSFSSAGGSSRARLAEIDATGSATAWNPGPYQYGNDFGSVAISAVAASGSRTFVGGTIVALNPVSRGGMAAIDLRDGSILPFNPKPEAEYGAVLWTFVPGPDDTVYVGGTFDTIAGVDRHGAAQLSLATGEATDWDPNPDGGAPGGVYSIAYDSVDETVYMGGEFDTLGPAGEEVQRPGIAAVDARTGAPTAWNPGIGGGYEPYPYGLAVSPDGGTVYAAGGFTRIGSPEVDRPGLAALSAADGSALAFNPEPNDAVSGIVAGPGAGEVTVWGNFTDIAGTDDDDDPATRSPGIAILDGTSGALSPHSPYGSEDVYAAAYGDSSHLFAGGSFNVVGPPPQVERENVAGWSAGDEGNFEPTDFAPGPGPDVWALAASPENAVFIGGEYLYFEANGIEGFASFTPPPVSAAPPQVSGTARPGATLSATAGDWTGEGKLGHRYRWLRCSAAGDDCEQIPGAKDSEYEVVYADVGHSLRFRDTEVTVGGEAASVSEAVEALAPSFSVPPVAQDFGTITVDTHGDPVELEVTSDGVGAVTFPAAAASLAGDQFALGADGCAEATLEPGASCTVAVAFAPTAGGAATGVLSIQDTEGLLVEVDLRGEGKPPVVEPAPEPEEEAPTSGGGTDPAPADDAPTSAASGTPAAQADAPAPKPKQPAAKVLGVVGTAQGGKATLNVRCPAGGGRCQGSVTLQSAAPTAAKSKHPQRFGGASFKIQPGTTRKLKISLNGAAKRLLGERGSLIAYAVASTRGTSGKPVKRLKLKAPTIRN